MELASRLKNLRLSPTLSLTEQANHLKDAGKSIITLSVGEPDFPTPPWIIDAAYEAAKRGQTRYTAVGGTPELKNAIISKFKRDNGISYQRNEVMASVGGKQAIFNCMLATLNTGDEVIIPAPYWVSYPDIIDLCDGQSVIIKCPASQNFKLTASQLEQSITSRTKWLILNGPSNPTGMIYSEQELQQFAVILERYPHVMVLSDDIYEHLIYAGHPFCTLAQVAPHLKDRILTINSVSKSYAMTGWRIGYAGGPAELIAAMTNIQSQSTSNPCSIAQAAAVAALTGDQEFLIKWRRQYQERRDFMINALMNTTHLTCITPSGAFYLFVSCRAYMNLTNPQGGLIANDVDLSAYLLDQAGLAIVPGSAFGAPDHLRLSFALDLKELELASVRLIAALNHLVPR